MPVLDVSGLLYMPALYASLRCVFICLPYMPDLDVSGLLYMSALYASLRCLSVLAACL